MRVTSRRSAPAYGFIACDTCGDLDLSQPGDSDGYKVRDRAKKHAVDNPGHKAMYDRITTISYKTELVKR